MKDLQLAMEWGMGSNPKFDGMIASEYNYRFGNEERFMDTLALFFCEQSLWTFGL